MVLHNNPFSQPKKQEVAAIQESELYRQDDVLPPSMILRAVIVSDTMPMANLDGKIMMIGEEVDGIKLLSVKEGGAIFEWQGRTYPLNLGNNDLDDFDEANAAKK
jgi:hypothetical protein